MNDSPTILHLIDSLRVGGAQASVRNLIFQMATTGRYRQVVCCLQNANGEILSGYEKDGIPTVVLNHHKYSPLLLHSVCRVCRRYNVMAIHAHLAGSAILGAYAKMRKAAPFLICHLRGEPDEDDWLRGRLVALALRQADWIIPVSQRARKATVDKYGLAIGADRVIYNGIRLRDIDGADRQKASQELGVNPGEVAVGFVGRLHPVKNVDVLISAAIAANKKNRRIRLIIVGGGPLEGKLRRMARDSGPEHTIKFLGMRRDVPNLLPGFDIFVMPSRSEGLPNAPLEAMGAGRPVIATTVGGMPEVVVDGQTGLLVPPNDARSLAEAILVLASDPEKRTAMGMAARRRVEELFSIENTARRVKEVYDKLLSENIEAVARSSSLCSKE